MENKIIQITNSNIKLNTFMSLNQFAKARYSEKVITEPGYLAKKENNTWTFSTWNFSETSESKDEKIIIHGKFTKSKTLSSIINNEIDSPFTVFILSEICTVIEEAINNKISLPDIGAGGILISEDAKKILFLPKLFFKSSLLCANDDNLYSTEHGLYINENLSKSKSLKFIQAVFAYIALTKEFPFAELNSEKRNIDILDLNFTPLENKILGINSELANAINSNLSLKNPTEKINQYSKNKKANKIDITEKKFPKEIFFSESGLSEKGTLNDNGQLNTIIRATKISQEEFEKKVQSKKEKKEFLIETKRWCRKHRTAITISVFFMGIISIIGISSYNTKMRKPSTIGLSPKETIEMYYSAVNTLDIDAAMYSSTGKEMKSRTGVLSNIYVSAKSKSMYDPKLETQPISKWLCYNQTKFNFGGVSQLFIDKSQGKIFFEGKKLKEKEIPYNIKTNTEIEEGKILQFNVTYKTIFSEGEDSLTVTYNEDIVTLVWNKNKWLIKSLSQNPVEKFYSQSEFVKVYNSLVKKFPNDIDSITRELRQIYDFIPTDNEIQEAITVISTEKLW